MKIRRLLTCIVLLIFLIVGCSHQNPKIIEKEKFIKIFTQLEIINQGYSHTTDSTARLKKEKIDSLFKSFDSNQEEFLSTVKFYQNTPVVWNDILQKSSLELNQMRDQKNK